MRLMRQRLIRLNSLDYSECFEHTDDMEKARGIPVLIDSLGCQMPLQRIYLWSGNQISSIPYSRQMAVAFADIAKLLKRHEILSRRMSEILRLLISSLACPTQPMSHRFATLDRLSFG